MEGILNVAIARSHWFVSRPLVSAPLSLLDPHWDSSWVSCCCPVSWRSCSFGSAGLTPPRAPAGNTREGVWVSQLVALILGLGGWRVGQLASFPCPTTPPPSLHDQSEFSSTALASSPLSPFTLQR
ncbi:hypothetical protein LEMLEM_LOCUS1378 [Lemmus lemmus]